MKARLPFLLSLLIVTIAVAGFSLYENSRTLTIAGTGTVTPPVTTTTPPVATSTPRKTLSSTPPIIIPPIVTPSTTTTTPPVVTPPAPPLEVLNDHFGISLGDTLPFMSPAALDAELDDIASLHIGWIRIDMAWNDIQPTQTSFIWSNLDRVVAAANARNIKVLGILDYTPRWARTPACANSPSCIASDPNLYQTFVRATVSHFAPQGVSAWEIWNEPNLAGAWQPQPSAVQYVTLLKGAYIAIKSVESSSTVVTGGLGPSATAGGSISPTDFLAGVYAAGGKNYFDAVGDHPYSYPAVPSNYEVWNAWSQISQTTTSLRSVMIMNQDWTKPIWLTEYGAPTNGPGALAATGTGNNFINSPDHVTEALQAEMLSEAVASVTTMPWTGPLFWYSYKDLGTSTSTKENFFGLIRYDGSTKPAYATFRNLISPL